MRTKILLLAPAAWLCAVFAFADHYSSGREIRVPLPADTSPAVRHGLADVACAGDQCLVAWTAWNEANRMGYEIRGARMSSSGTLIDRTSFTIASVSSLNTTPAEVIALESEYVVFYSGMRYARVTRDGVVTARDEKTSFSSEMGSVREAVTAGGSILMYSVENRGPLVPYLTILDGDLKVVRELTIEGAPTDIAAAGAGFVVASTSVDGLRVTRLTSAGTATSVTVIPEWNAAGVIAGTAETALVAWRRPTTNESPATVEVAMITADGPQPPVVLERSISNTGSLDVAAHEAGYLVTWSRETSGFYSDRAFARRISATGEVVDPAPVGISVSPHLQHQVKCVATGAGYVMIWNDWRFGGGHDHVFAAPVPLSGPVGADFLVSRLFVSQSHSVLATAGQTIGVAWLEAAGDAAGSVLFTRVRLNGTMFGTDPIRFSNVGGKPSLATDGTLFIVAWREWGFARFAIVGQDGRVIAPGGVTTGGFGGVSVAAGQNHFLLTFDSNGAIFTVRVRYDGVVLDADPRPHTVGSDPKVAFDGDGYWMAYRAGAGVDARRISRDGMVVDPVPFILARGADGVHDQLTIACGDDHCGALWRATRGRESSIEGAVLTGGGPVSIRIPARSFDVAEPALVWNDGAYMMTWSERGAAAPNLDIHAVALAASGNLFGSPISIADSESDERFPAVSSAGGDRVFAFSRASDGSGARLFLRFENDPRRRRAIGR